MEIILLGTGTGVPSAHRASPGLAVLANGAVFLIDGGSGTLRQLALAGLNYDQLDCILYTHFHPDHVGDLVPYLFASRYFGFQRSSPARILGPPGLLDLYGHLRAAFGQWIEPPQDMVVLEELPPGGHEFTQNGIRIKTGPVPHTPHSLGYRLTEQGGPTVAVTGDTDYGPELVDLARGADALITECSFPEGQKKDGHLTPDLAGRAAREAGVDLLVLTHFYPETRGHDLEASVRKEFDGHLILGEDLQRLVLTNPDDGAL